jgi:hypothetical protein
MQNVLQLFDLVEKSVLVFATTVNKPSEPIAYPSTNLEGKSNKKNPYCEEKLIHVKFVKITQKSLRIAKRCANIHSKEPNKLDLEPTDKTDKQTKERYVIVCCLHNNSVSRYLTFLSVVVKQKQ